MVLHVITKLLNIDTGIYILNVVTMVTCHRLHKFWLNGGVLMISILFSFFVFDCVTLVFLTHSVSLPCVFSSALDQWLSPAQPILLTGSQSNTTLVRKESSSKVCLAYKWSCQFETSHNHYSYNVMFQTYIIIIGKLSVTVTWVHLLI